MKKSNLLLILLFISVLCVSLLTQKYVFSIAIVRGDSMLPAFHNGDLVVVWKWKPDLIPGDVFVFSVLNKQQPSKTTRLIKRLIAGPNSKIYIDDFKVYVNGKPFKESPEFPPIWDKNSFFCRFTEVYTTGENEVFALGDNRCNSMDSRSVGPVLDSTVVGEVMYQNKWLRRLMVRVAR